MSSAITRQKPRHHYSKPNINLAATWNGCNFTGVSYPQIWNLSSCGGRLGFLFTTVLLKGHGNVATKCKFIPSNCFSPVHRTSVTDGTDRPRHSNICRNSRHHCYFQLQRCRLIIVTGGITSFEDTMQCYWLRILICFQIYQTFTKEKLTRANLE